VLPPEPNDQGDRKDGKQHAHGYTLSKPDSRRARVHLVLREHGADDGDEWYRGSGEAAPPGQRAGLSKPPNGPEYIRVEEIVWPDALRLQGERQGRQRQESIDIPR
jgi:hypothetical protein